MGRILALDYGSKRVGLAETDDLQIISSPLDTVHSKDLIKYLKDYCTRHVVDVIVVGEPKRLDGSDTHSSKMINEFVVHLKKKFPDLLVERVDERFTSVMAKQLIIEGGLSKSKRKDKGIVDAVSASIILQSYLQLKNG